MNWNKYKVKPKENFKLAKIDTDSGVSNYDEKELKKLKIKLSDDIEEIAKFQYKLFAENRQSLLIILQGMDSAGKDGTIKHIMSGINPQGVLIHSFKHPSALELEHDYLWRHTQKLPEHGQITIFNRSYYENVLISKVHPELVLAEHMPGVERKNKIDKSFWKKRYKQINNFEKTVIQNGTHILKIFLHLSKHEQRKRFIERIDNKEKHWKFSTDDIAERKFWKKYQDAYEQALKHTSTRSAPWYIIPADDKLHAHLLIGRIILKKLEKIDPSFPPVSQKEKKLMEQAKEKLKRESK